MLDLAQNFSAIVKGTIDHKSAAEFQHKLIVSPKAEMLAYEVPGKQDAKEKIIE